MASLFDAIVLQNLSVLTRGQPVASADAAAGRPQLLFPGLRQAWRHHLDRLWQHEKVAMPPADQPRRADPGAGARPVFRRHRAPSSTDAAKPPRWANTWAAPRWSVPSKLRDGVQTGNSGTDGLAGSEAELNEFLQQYAAPRPSSPPDRRKHRQRCRRGVPGHRRRLDLDQGGLPLAQRRRAGQRLPPLAGRPGGRRHRRAAAASAALCRKQHADGDSRLGHHRLLARSAAARLPRRRRAGGDRGPRQFRPAHSSRRGRHHRRGRAGHQDHLPQPRSGEGLPPEHPVLGRKRLLSAGRRRIARHRH